MDTGFHIAHRVDRNTQIATALREIEADIPMAEALEEQNMILERAQEQFDLESDFD